MEMTKQDALDLADAGNELCTAVEIFKLAHPELDSLAVKNIFTFKAKLWELLERFGY